jgi:hypothetical protein
MKLGVHFRPVLLAVAGLFAAHGALAQETAPPAVPAAQPEAAQVAAADLKYSNKWRIEVKEGANNDGVARFRVTPKGEAAVDVIVNIKDGRSENGVARDVKNTFKGALDAKRFHVEGDDGEDVLVKKKGGPDFSIELLESTLKGTRFDLERE